MDNYSVTDAITSTDEETADDLTDVESDQAITEEALRLLVTNSSTTYTHALATLREDTREWWAKQLSWEPDDYNEDQASYRDARRNELERRSLIRAQAFGEAVDPE